MKELIDQLDEDGEFLGVVDKDEAHQKGLWHRAVHVWIVNDKKEILLQYRCHQKKFFPDVWDASFAWRYRLNPKIEEMTILVSKYKSLRYLIKVSFIMQKYKKERMI